jgi:hypothetical protein
LKGIAMTTHQSRRLVSLAALPALFVSALAAVASAQFPRMPGGDGQITTMGRVHIPRSPTHLRMYLQINGSGKTLEEALAALKERREAVALQLEKLGVDRAALVFAPPGVDESQAAQQRRMEVMIAQRMGSRSKKAGKSPALPVRIVSVVTAQWPLEADTPEKLLLAAQALRDKIKEAKLSEGTETNKLSPEEQEVAEEMAASGRMGGDEEGPKPGEARFVFYAQLSPQDRRVALAKAFAKAKAKAAELAEAAGASLGPLSSLASESGMGGGYNPYSRYGYAFGRNDNEFVQQLAQSLSEDDQRMEAIGTRPDGVAFDIAVNASFAIGPATETKRAP